jgi:hypothetical protein
MQFVTGGKVKPQTGLRLCCTVLVCQELCPLSYSCCFLSIQPTSSFHVTDQYELLGNKSFQCLHSIKVHA